MKKTITFLIICVFALKTGNAQEQIMVNAFNRKAISLNGYWKYIVDPYENGFYNYRHLVERRQEPAQMRWAVGSTGVLLFLQAPACS